MNVAGGLRAVTAAHARLALHELGTDLAATGRRLGGALAAMLLMQAGMLLVAVALAVVIGRRLGDPALGFLLAGTALLIAGGALLLVFRRRLRRHDYLVRTRREMEESRRWLRDEIGTRLTRNG